MRGGSWRFGTSEFDLTGGVSADSSGGVYAWRHIWHISGSDKCRRSSAFLAKFATDDEDKKKHDGDSHDKKKHDDHDAEKKH